MTELFVIVFCLGFSVTFAVLNLLAWRRYQRLNVLLMEICLQAWAMRHMPIWIAWREMTGIEFRVVPARLRRPAE